MAEFSDIRRAAIQALKEATPTRYSGHKFVPAPAEHDFRAWAAASPVFRAFDVEDTHEYEWPELTNVTEAWMSGAFDLLVSYPMGQGGPQSRHEFDDLIAADEKLITNKIGPATSIYPQSASVFFPEGYDMEEGQGVWILAIRFPFGIWRQS